MKMNSWVKMLNGDMGDLKKLNTKKKISEEKLYRLSWQTGQQTTLLTHDESVRKINEWMNRKGWEWLRVLNTKTKTIQIVQEPKTDMRGGLHINKLNENMLGL